MKMPRHFLGTLIILAPFALFWAAPGNAADMFSGLTEKSYMKSDSVFLEHLVALPKDQQEALISEMVLATLAGLEDAGEEPAAVVVAAATETKPEPQYYTDPATGRRFIYDEQLKDWRVDSEGPQVSQYQQPAQQQYESHSYSGSGSGARNFHDTVQTMGAVANVIRLFR